LARREKHLLGQSAHRNHSSHLHNFQDEEEFWGMHETRHKPGAGQHPIN
jgi:hypothetical protein